MLEIKVTVLFFQKYLTDTGIVTDTAAVATLAPRWLPRCSARSGSEWLVWMTCSLTPALTETRSPPSRRSTARWRAPAAPTCAPPPPPPDSSTGRRSLLRSELHYLHFPFWTDFRKWTVPKVLNSILFHECEPRVGWVYPILIVTLSHLYLYLFTRVFPITIPPKLKRMRSPLGYVDL